jgi:predicted metalloprotease with PDZ domain
LFDAAVRGVEDPAVGELLLDFGIELKVRPSLGVDDKGGTPGPAPERPPLALGVSGRGVDGGFELAQVLEGGPAEQAGLLPKDILVAIDGLRIGEKSLQARLNRCEAGQRVEVTLFRGDELLSRLLVVEPATPDTCYLELTADAPDAALARRRAWLGH